jgi:hypothetical protein
VLGLLAGFGAEGGVAAELGLELAQVVLVLGGGLLLKEVQQLLVLKVLLLKQEVVGAGHELLLLLMLLLDIGGLLAQKELPRVYFVIRCTRESRQQYVADLDLLIVLEHVKHPLPMLYLPC